MPAEGRAAVVVALNEVATLTLPPNCSKGHGRCEIGMCYVCCNGWKRLINENHQRICREARDGRYTQRCEGGTVRLAALRPVSSCAVKSKKADMPQFNIVLDANIYRKNPTRSDLPFKALERLCRAGRCRLHIPYVVEREFQTQRQAQYQKDLAQALQALSDLLRKGLPPAEADAIKGLRDGVKTAEPRVLEAVESELIFWADSVGAVRHPLTEAAARAAMEAYFFGHPPLTAPKTRTDIPDAFIFQTIKDIADGGSALFVVSEDEKLAKAVESLPNTRVLRSLAAMIELQEVQAEILDLDVVDNLAGVAGLLCDWESQYHELTGHLEREGGRKILWERVAGDTIPDDNHEATICRFGDPRDIELDFSEFAYFGSGQFGLKFRFVVSVSLSYYIFKSDYYCMDEEKMPSVTDHNDHYFEAEEEREVLVHGALLVSFPMEQIKSLSLETIDDFVEIQIDSIDDIQLVEE